MPPHPRPLTIGIVGAGLGGLTASIALSRGGAHVTVLESTTELGEIGAGIQMFGNVSRFLIRTGVDKIIGDDLVQHDEVRTWGQDVDGEFPMIGRIDERKVVRDQGFPWWVVRRDHLHNGLVEGARRDGVEIVTGFRVGAIEEHGVGQGVTVVSEKGERRKFDLVIGADGLRSYMRRYVFPDLKPKATSNIAAYRAVVSYKEVFDKIPEARSRLGNTMDLWVGPGGYILLYPLSGGKELNVVTAYEQPRPVTEVEDVDVRDFRDHYKSWDPFIRRVLDLVTEIKRWPLLVIPPVKSWSNKDKNIVLMGDAIHSIQNHAAQGAATAMEDGMFLGRVVSEVIRGTIDLETAINLYEKKRIPRAFHKGQVAFVNGKLYGVEGNDKLARDRSTRPEIAAWDSNVTKPAELPPTYRTWQLYTSPTAIMSVLCYDAESDADFAVDEWLMSQGDVDETTLVSKGLREKWWSAIHDNGVENWKGVKDRKAKL